MTFTAKATSRRISASPFSMAQSTYSGNPGMTRIALRSHGLPRRGDSRFARLGTVRVFQQASSSIFAAGVRSRFPPRRSQIQDLLGRMSRDPLQHVLQILERVLLVPAARGDQAR